MHRHASFTLFYRQNLQTCNIVTRLSTINRRKVIVYQKWSSFLALPVLFMISNSFGCETLANSVCICVAQTCMLPGTVERQWLSVPSSSVITYLLTVTVSQQVLHEVFVTDINRFPKCFR